MKHPLFAVEVWQAGRLVIRSESTDSAARAKRMALDMRGLVDGWHVSVTIDHPHDSFVSLSQDELDRLDSFTGALQS